jgi:hypothetical protein
VTNAGRRRVQYANRPQLQRRSGLRITGETCLDLIRTKPGSFFHDHVRHVALIDVPLDVTIPLLSQCTGIIGLALSPRSTEPALLPVLDGLRPRRLAADVQRLFNSASPVDFTCAVFSQLTHLHLHNDFHLNFPPTSLAQLPCLTHIAFRIPVLPAYLHDTLAHCPRLEILAFLDTNAKFFDSHLRKFFAENLCCVFVLVENPLVNWELGAYGDDDHWQRAERFVRQRRAGEISGRLRRITPEGHGLTTYTLASECVVPPTNSSAPPLSHRSS